MARSPRRPRDSAEAEEAGARGADSSQAGSRIWFTVRLLLVVLAAVLVWRGREHLLAWRISLARHRIDASTLVVRNGPPWLTAEDVASIEKDSGLAGERLSLFTPDLSRRLDEAFRRSPWVSGVSFTRLLPPNRVEVYLELRYGKPVAGILGKDGFIYLVDERGLRLPGRRRRPPRGLERPFRRIDGVVTPPPPPGELWSEAVREGAWVARELFTLSPETAREASIVSVDVSNVGGRRDRFTAEIVLHTSRKAVVEWGRSGLSSFGDLDPPVEVKVERIERSLSVYHGFAGLRRVKLQFDELIVVEIDDRPVERIAPNVHGG